MEDKRGGVRKGAGRPKLVEGGANEKISVRVNKDQLDTFIELGGAEWLRNILIKYKKAKRK